MKLRRCRINGDRIWPNTGTTAKKKLKSVLFMTESNDLSSQCWVSMTDPNPIHFLLKARKWQLVAMNMYHTCNFYHEVR